MNEMINDGGQIKPRRMRIPTGSWVGLVAAVAGTGES